MYSPICQLKYIVFCSMFLCSTPVSAECLLGDCKNGSGVLVHEDGRRYSGEFEEGAIQGNGELKYSNGTVYKGEFEKGRFQGTGVLTNPDGRRYE
ncbi:MAG: hypothetical protein KAR01_08550, partial [Desulfocapsa sp.]|nr:hypothetical protein [Desulfocapsa sp.]